jgi:hypothetical protein
MQNSIKCGTFLIILLCVASKIRKHVHVYTFEMVADIKWDTQY